MGCIKIHLETEVLCFPLLTLEMLILNMGKVSNNEVKCK